MLVLPQADQQSVSAVCPGDLAEQPRVIAVPAGAFIECSTQTAGERLPGVQAASSRIELDTSRNLAAAAWRRRAIIVRPAMNSAGALTASTA